MPAAQLVISNVVVVAHQFNPSLMSQLWLVRNDIVAEADFRPGCLLSDVVANVRTRQFDLFVVPEQLQFVPRCEAAEEATLIADKVGRIVRTLPHTPFSAMGLNFTWTVLPDEGEDATALSRTFFLGNSPLYREFDFPSARFGAYMSKDALGCRLKLDIKPLTPPAGQGPERFGFQFNFHLDITDDNPVQQIERMLRNWTEAKAESERLIEVTTRQGA